jgi:DNA-binding SARP family transcriptional activator/tetratricopeptide (TPR) repeat protein
MCEMADGPEIRLLGELEVVRRGQPCPLPASKKTRALLGYLAVTGRPQTREQLCDLLWQGPDDPRAALRWSLAKLRSVLGPESLVTDRERIGLGPVSTDLDVVRATGKGNLETLSVEVLAVAAERFRGELLEGLALPDCYRYHEWFVAERESARGLRISIVTALVRRASKPEEALRWAREHVALDPLSEEAHIRVIRLLGELGRRREAIAQFETCRRILAQETNTKPSPGLLEARMAIAPPPSVGPQAAPSAPPKAEDRPSVREAPQQVAIPLVGRLSELSIARAFIEGARSDLASTVLVVLGEPGIGKSRILAELGQHARDLGGTVLSGRAFEAEMVRPYGPFVDALRAVPASAVPEAIRPELAALVPALGGTGPHDRVSMFEAVVRLLLHLSDVSGPVVMLLDDLHWFDEASAGLLHYVARAVRRARVFIACGTRPGELSDNPAALRLVRGLSRERLSQTIELGSLDEEATAALSRAIAPDVDLERVVRDSAGNPLLALELARALARDAGAVWESIADLIAERLACLDAAALDLVSFAAALGKSFDLETLERVSGTPAVELLALVGNLERHGIVRASSDGQGFDFVHDLVRTGAYRRLSEPTRRVVHRRIARTLSEMNGADAALAGEITHHAELGGDPVLVVRSAIAAARRCLRMFAGTEGARLADLGLEHLDALPREERLPAQIALLEVLVYSRTAIRRPDRLSLELASSVAEAQSRGDAELASKGLHVLSVLQFDGGDLAGAHESTLRAAGAVRGADALSRARQLGDSARCLTTLERDLDQAQSMMQEALAIIGESGAELLEMRWASGILSAFAGECDDAARSLTRALALARSAEDRWVEYECLRSLVQLDIEQRRPTAWCGDLLAVASKMGEGSELSTARALEALDRLVRQDASAGEELEGALSVLRDLDAKGMSAYVLNFAAEYDVDRGRLEMAEHRAEEALRAAAVVDRRSQVALARAVLGHVALARNDRKGAQRHFEAVRSDFERPLALSARARSALSSLESALGRTP